MNTNWIGHYFLSFLPATPLSQSLKPEGLFELTQCPPRAHDSPCALLLELVLGARRRGPLTSEKNLS